MAQFYFPAAALGVPGQPITNGNRETDADFFLRPPFVTFESLRTANATSSFLLPGISAADVDVHFRVRVIRQGGDSFPNTGPGLFLRYQDIENHLYFGSPNPFGGSSVWTGMLKLVSNTQTVVQVGAVSAITVAISRWLNVRVKISGSSMQFARWLDTSSPPALSTAETQDYSGAPASGAIGFRGRSFGSSYELGAVAVGTDGDPPPDMPAAGSVSGIVRDSSGSPTQRTVRAYDRLTGALIDEVQSDPSTGLYTVTAPLGREIQRIALDDDAGDLYNDILDRVIPG